MRTKTEIKAQLTIRKMRKLGTSHGFRPPVVHLVNESTQEALCCSRISKLSGRWVAADEQEEVSCKRCIGTYEGDRRRRKRYKIEGDSSFIVEKKTA